jgi:hypothetical protein
MNDAQRTLGSFDQLANELSADLTEILDKLEEDGIDLELIKTGDVSLMDLVTGKADRLPFKLRVSLAEEDEL